MEGFKKTPLEALFSFIAKANPTKASKINPAFFTVSTLTNLGTANPNTTVKLQGNGVDVTGIITVAYNRINIKKVFNVFGSVLKRPVVKIHKADNSTTTVTVKDIITQINATLGIDFDTVSVYKDFAGTGTFTLPAIGASIDVDIPVDGGSLSLRLIPDAANPLQVRIYAQGYIILGVITDRYIRPFISASGYLSLKNAGLVNLATGNAVINAQLYGADFTSVFDSVDFATQTDRYKLKGDVVTRFNDKLTALGIGAMCAGDLVLSGQHAHRIYATAPVADSGGNPNFTSNVVIDPTCLTFNSGVSAANKVYLGIRNALGFVATPDLATVLEDIDFSSVLGKYSTSHVPAGFADALTLVNLGGSDDATQWWTFSTAMLAAINAQLTAQGLPVLPDQVRIANRYLPTPYSDPAVLWAELVKTAAGRTHPARANWAGFNLQLDLAGQPFPGYTASKPIYLYFSAT